MIYSESWKTGKTSWGEKIRIRVSEKDKEEELNISAAILAETLGYE